MAGVIVSDLPHATTAYRKRRRSESESRVRLEDMRKAVDRARALDQQVEEEFATARARIVDSYLDSERYRDEILGELKPLLEQALNQTHDFVALLKQIKANVIAILEEQFPGEPPEEAADRLQNVGAIYFASELMLGKIDATNFLREPNLVYGKQSTFTLHRFMSKYIKIYRSFARQRDLDFFVGGRSFGLVSYNAEAIGVVVQALLDNVVKYAPPGSKVDVVLDEGADAIGVRFCSLGPEIGKKERRKIFLVGYRGEAAEALEASGMGFGLAAAKVVSDGLDLNIASTQEERESVDHPGYYETEFSISFRKVGTES